MKKENKPQAERRTISRRKAIAAAASMAGLTYLPAFAQKNEKGRMNSSVDPHQAFPHQLSTLRNGISRQFTTFNIETKQKAVPIKPGTKATLVNYNKPGIITRMWITFSGWFWENWDLREEKWPDATILKKLILRIYWDGNAYPSVEAPMGDFFGVGHCEFKHYLSNYLGMSSGGFYSYFPMPFEKIRIEVENMHDRIEPHVFLNANYQEMAVLAPDMGRFHCLYNAGTNPGPDPLTILKTTGRGHFAGCCLSMQSWLPNYLGYLEAPEYFYIDTDDRSKASIVGTGLEDYFNGGWYFRDGEFAGPYHGVPLKDPLRSMISMYRFHHDDAVCFNKSIEMAFINHRPSREFKFSSTAYWYQDKAVKLAFELPAKDKLVDWYRIRDTDHQSIP